MLVKRIGNHTLPVPSRESEFAGGYDLRAKVPVTLLQGQAALVPTGFAMAIPTGWVGLIWDRSGLATMARVTTRAGVIDSDYRGEVFVALVNESSDWQTVKEGERIAQIVVVPHWSDACLETDDLEETVRGDDGFGSTGND